MSLTRAQYHGGSVDVSISGSANMVADRRVHIVEAANANDDLVLVDDSLFKAGGPIFIVINDSANTIELRDKALNLIATITNTQVAEVYLSDGGVINGTTRTWYARVMTKNGSRLIS